MKILEQQDAGTCSKTLKLEISREEVENEMDEIYKEFIQHADVPGFRRGKVPRHIVKMRYGKHLDKEAVNKAVETAFKEAIDELKLDPVSQPEIGEIGEPKKEEPVVVDVTFEYRPDVEIADYHDIRPEPPSNEVTEQEVVEILNNIRDQNAMYTSVDDRPVAENDHVNIAIQATYEEQPLESMSHDDITVEVGSKQYLPGLEDALIGMNLGEQKEVELTLPENFQEEEKRGKPAQFQITVNQIREKKLPELDDELAKDMGNFETLDELKENIRHTLRHTKENQREEQMRQSIRQELLDRNQFEVPPSMVKAQYNYINAIQDGEYRRMGRSLDDMVSEDPELLSRNEKTAQDEVRLSTILDKIAKKEEIELSDEEFQAYVMRMAQSSQADPHWLMERIQSQGMESFYRRIALEEKVMNLLKQRVESELEKPQEDQEETQDNQEDQEESTSNE